MSNSGTWTLVLARVEPGNTATIEVVDTGTGATEPEYFLDEQTIGFLWRSDGRRSIWPWSNLLSADFTPTSATGADAPPKKANP